jgi:hypothetical protein
MHAHESPQPLCHRCGSILTPGEGSFFVIRIEAFADPTPPDLTGLSEGDLLREIDDLIDAVNEMSEQELMDEVYRKLTILLCRPCYRLWITNPAR